MLITGASTGVGRAAALRFAEEGYTVCALARNEANLASLREQRPESIRTFPCDVRDASQVSKTVEAILSERGAVDVLINSAGVTAAGAQTSPELIDKVIDTNLKGTMYITHALLPSMRANGGGSIFNIASIAGVDIKHDGTDGLYGASKHGMVAFSELIGKKYRSDGILVTAISPGGIDTPLWSEENPYPYDPSQRIRPEEIADLIAYILSQPRRTLFKNVIFVPAVEPW
jgi:3-oxoacyl-[acyl-carrier protein] reductase